VRTEKFNGALLSTVVIALIISFSPISRALTTTGDLETTYTRNSYATFRDPTLTFYSSASDGESWGVSSDYQVAHDALLGQTEYIGYPEFSIGQWPAYIIARSYVFFDTSAIPDDAIITAATLSLHGARDSSDYDFDIVIQSGMPTYPHDPPVDTDYYYVHYSGDGGRFNTSGFSTTGYNDIVLNETGRSWINKTGITKFCLRSSRDINSTIPSGHEYVEVCASEGGSGYQPKLTVTYIGLPDYGVSVTVSPSYLEGLPGGTLKPYTVKVTNMGLFDDNYTLTAWDNSGWGLTLSGLDVGDNLQNVPGFFNSRTVTLKVKVPENAAPGTVDNVLIKATGKTGVSDNFWCLAIAGRWIRPTTDDAQVVEGEPWLTHGAQTFMCIGSSTTGGYLDERAFLKFDLQGIASSDNITSESARLFVYGFTVGGTPGKNVELCRVDNDNWVEENITWNDQPAYGEWIGRVTVTEAAAWYSWDVTSYVDAQFTGDNIASFCIKAQTEGLAYPDNFSYGFHTKEYSSWADPRIAIGRNVWMTIDPEYREGLPGGTVKYTVDVWNMGSLADTFNLSVGDNAGWSPTISPTTLALAAGQKGTATVSVTIPVSARICVDNDNITVAATSQNDPTVKDNNWVIAHAAKRVKPATLDTSTKGGLGLGLPPTIWGLDDTIYAGRAAGGPERGWLRFDLGAIPSLDNIARARLILHSTTILGVGAIVRVYSVANDTWIEDENWTSTPPIDNLLDTRAVTKADDNYSWDVTAFVRDQWENDPQKLASFALVDLGENIENVENHAARFTSRDDYDARDVWPYLEVWSNAQLPTYDVRTSVSPIYQGGIPGKTLNYTVTVKNTGTVADTYDLDNSDTKNWVLNLSPSTLTIENGAENYATLTVTVPSGDICTLDRITVTASSQTNPAVKDNAIAFAHRSYAYFKLENMTKVSIDLNLRLREDAENLVAKFYHYYDLFQGENVIWESMPWHLISKPYVLHPQGKPVEKVRLVLVDGAGAEIATVETYKVVKPDLIKRAALLKGQWDLVPPGEPKSAIIREMAMIKGQWELAPPS